MWANFARTGDPSVPGLEWPAYDLNKRQTAIIGEKPYIESDPLSLQREKLSQLLRYMFIPSYASLDYNVPFVRKLIAITLAIIAITAAVLVLIFTG